MKAIVPVILLLLFSCAPKLVTQKPPQKEEARIPSYKTVEFKRSIHDKVLARESELDACFDAQIAKDSEFSVRKVMSLFTLTSQGKVEAASVVALDPLGEDFKKCFQSVIRSIEFEPVPDKDQPLLIFYPIEYRKHRKND